MSKQTPPANTARDTYGLCLIRGCSRHRQPLRDFERRSSWHKIAEGPLAEQSQTIGSAYFQYSGQMAELCEHHEMMRRIGYNHTLERR